MSETSHQLEDVKNQLCPEDISALKALKGSVFIDMLYLGQYNQKMARSKCTAHGEGLSFPYHLVKQLRL